MTIETRRGGKKTPPRDPNPKRAPWIARRLSVKQRSCAELFATPSPTAGSQSRAR